ncbi:MAG TPA: DUF559 domain-containing protein [Solirubrobacterales bacterium]|nr:DUF559 domain-containing protein [Solirubrobacterales bacterium]
MIVAGNAGKAQRDGIRVHRSLSLPISDVTLRGGIPVTIPARTIVDLRRAIPMGRPGMVSSGELKKAIRQASVIGLPIGDDAAADRTRSDLESDFLAICRRYGLPQPEVNVRIGPFLVDFLWREERLVVETDGYRYHRGRAAFQDDRSREVELMRLGYGVMHLAERQINAEGRRVAEALTVALAGRHGD